MPVIRGGQSFVDCPPANCEIEVGEMIKHGLRVDEDIKRQAESIFTELE